MTTQYVRPPTKRKARGKAKAEPELVQVRKFLYRHRDDFAPYWTALAVLLVALIAEPFGLSWLWLPAAYGALAAALYRFGDKVLNLNREIERRYAALCAAVAGAWSAWMIAGSIQPLAALPILTGLVAIPWHRHRGVRASVPVTFADGLTSTARREAGQRAGALINGWAQITTQGKIKGATLKALTFDPYSMTVDVTLRGGQSDRTLSYPAYQSALESAFSAPKESLRVEDYGSKDARDVRLRFLLENPNAEGLGVPQDVGVEDIVLGRFETADPVVLTGGCHTGIFGRTGAGKSGVMNLIIRKVRRRRNWAMVGIDLKPGAPEFSPWGNAWFYLADTPEKAKFVLESLMVGLTVRGNIMRERGWRSWLATPAEPGVALFVDELQQLRRHGLMNLLEDLAGLIRAYGFELIVATQYPIDKNCPTTVMEALSQVVGLKTSSDRADRVVFGENATREGWTPSKLPDLEGSFLIRSKVYRKPVPARAHFLTDKDVERENAAGPGPVLLDVATAARWVERGQYPGEISSAREMDPLELEGIRPEEIMDAVVVDDSRQQVLDAVAEGIGKPADIAAATQIPKRTVNDLLAALARDGQISQDAPRKPWRIAEPAE